MDRVFDLLAWAMPSLMPTSRFPLPVVDAASESGTDADEELVLGGGSTEAYLLALREETIRAAAIEDPPDAFLCPITNEAFIDPVVLSSGHSYENKDIVEWLARDGLCPITREPASVVAHNVTLRKSIEAWASGVLARDATRQEEAQGKRERDAED
jgi:hypothetical protein